MPLNVHYPIGILNLKLALEQQLHSSHTLMASL